MDKLLSTPAKVTTKQAIATVVLAYVSLIVSQLAATLIGQADTVIGLPDAVGSAYFHMARKWEITPMSTGEICYTVTGAVKFNAAVIISSVIFALSHLIGADLLHTKAVIFGTAQLYTACGI